MMISRFTSTTVTLLVLIAFFCAGLMFQGCEKSSTSDPALSNSPTVNLSVSFAKAGTEGLEKSSGGLFVDSLHIDSAAVVFSRITFLPHPDSSVSDSGDEDGDWDGEHEGHGGWESHNDSLSFKGPFIVHVEDTVGIDLASKELPAGIYDGIRIQIHKLAPGEKSFECGHHHRHNWFVPDTNVVGSSITVWGSMYKDGAWRAFTFHFDGEFEFTVKNGFIVPVATSNVNLALHIDMGAWFRNPYDGSLLDPTDRSHENLKMFRRAIRASFEGCKVKHEDEKHHGDD